MRDCLKQVVTATIVAKSGVRFVGKNWIAQDPGPVCPREVAGCASGAGYHLCLEICHQIGHAEINALSAAGSAARGATLYLEGHTYACELCRAACAAAGIASIVIGAPPDDLR